MTREDSLSALYRAVFNKLNNASTLWATRVYPDSVDARSTRPYVVFAVVAGGDANRVHNPDAEYLISVKCVADKQQDAMDGAAAISVLMNDQGTQDHPASPLDGVPDWEIVTSTQGRRLHMKDPFAGVQPIFHDGFEYRIRMEAR